MTVLLVQVISCAWMTGLIWIIQVLHYPCFLLIRESEFAHFHAGHTQRITYLVLPAMLLELLSGFILMWSSHFQQVLVANFLMILVIWMSTAFLSVPIHNQLASQQDFNKIRRLVLTNWPRTLLWSLRLGLLTVYFMSQLKES
jgi:hypothetical protein